VAVAIALAGEGRRVDTPVSEVPLLRTKPDVIATKDRLADTWETARDAIAPQLTAARVAVTPYVEEAATRVAPLIEQARTKVSPAVDTARIKLREDITPAVLAAVESARESSGPTRAEAKERANNALLALQGKQKKARRWPIAAACLFAGAAAGITAGTIAAAKRAQQRPPVPPATPFPATPVDLADAKEESATTERLR
jgi:hypothetical protein